MITIKTILKQKIKQVVKEKYNLPDLDFEISYPPSADMGDYSCNVAMILAPMLKKDPMEIGKEIIDFVTPTFRSEIKKSEIIKPGFLNFYLSEKFLLENLKTILKEKEKFGALKPVKKQKIQVEFISANPTGPLTLANGRGGFTGDVLANVLGLAGHKVEREYYVNDYGNQIRMLGHSILKDKQAQYKGEYIDNLANKIFLDSRLAVGQADLHQDDKKNPDTIGQLAAKIILEKMVKPVIKKIGIKFDNWFSEKKLHENGAVDKMFEYLKKKNLTYKKDGAWWLKTNNNKQSTNNKSNINESDDDKDRVLIKSDGSKTYFLPDIAYHWNKFHDRKFDKVINLWGADHHGYVPRMKQAVALLGFPGQLEILLMQMVRLIKNGQEFKMSKRAGVYVLLEELVDMVGLDVTRFFFLMHSNNKAVDFDLDLAKKRSNKNPVFYVQYAHARICSILEKTSSSVILTSADLPVANQTRIPSLKHKILNQVEDDKKTTEKELIKELIKWPEIIEEVAENYEVHKIPFYAIALADKFHDFYENCRVIDENNQVNRFRLNLIKATKQILENVLKTLGVSAPEKM